MRNNIVRAFVAAFSLVSGYSSAAVSLQFSSPFDTGIASNFSTRLGSAGVDGLKWGIIVDSSGNGFSSSYDGLSGGTIASGTLSSGGIASDDIFYLSSQLTLDYSNPAIYLEGDGTTPGGHGSIDTISNVLYSGNVGVGDKFALVWFDSNSANNGDYYGFFSDASFVLPSDGTLLESSYAAAFQGVDPVRNASNQFGTATVPEPSRLLLLGFAMVGLVLRRRR